MGYLNEKSHNTAVDKECICIINLLYKIRNQIKIYQILYTFAF